MENQTATRVLAKSSDCGDDRSISVLRGLAMSTLAAKYVMALTGLGLTFFVIVHLFGNLLIFFGYDALNSYAEALQEHFVLLWLARTVLFAAFTVHIAVGIQFTIRNCAARPVRYFSVKPAQSTWAAQHMLLTGLVVMAFIVYHLLHFTFGVIDPGNFKSVIPADARGRHDVSAMVVAGFSQPLVAAAYVVAQLVLGLHLAHGVWSSFQSLGINSENPLYQPSDVSKTKNWRRCSRLDGRGYAWLVHMFGALVVTVVVLGNCSIPLAIQLGWRPSGFNERPNITSSIGISKNSVAQLREGFPQMSRDFYSLVGITLVVCSAVYFFFWTGRRK
jgi:succinate dehydrogenase / fumarate reductase cytochrome b subunit